MKTIRFIKPVAVDLFDGKHEEIFSKSFHKWDVVKVNALHEFGKKYDMELTDGSTIYDVPSESFEVL